MENTYWNSFLDQYEKELPDLTLRQTLEAFTYFIESGGGSGAESFIKYSIIGNALVHGAVGKEGE